MASVGAVAEAAADAAAPAAAPPREPLPQTRLARTPTILQLESVECGAAALSMVLAHHGRWIPLEQMRVDCGVSRDGSKAGGLLRAARAHGMTARGFKKEPNAIAQLPLPAIVFWNFNHFVVLEGFRDGRAYLNDPARGRRSVDAEEFDQAFTGVVLTFEPAAAFERGGHPPSVMRSLRQYLDGFRTSIALAIFVGLTLVIPGVWMPWLLGRFVDDVLVAHMEGFAEPLLLGLIIAAIARSVLVGIQARLLMDTFGRAARASAKRFFAHALALPMTFYSQRSAGEIAARVDLNERVAETISADLAHLALDFLTASFFLVLMARMEPRLATIVVGCLALELFVWRALARRTAEASQELSVQAGKLAGMATGGLANIESVKAGGQETALFLKWIGLQVQYVNASIRAQRYLLTLGQAPSILGLVALLAVLGLGIVLIMQGSFTVGDLVAFQVLLAGFTAPIHALFTHTQKLQTLRGDLARLDDVLHHDIDERIDVNATSREIPVSPIAGTVEFRNVTFGYSRGEAPLIEDFSLTVNAGGRVALVGASGSGKSTVAKLAAGLYKPWSGEILFDGKTRDAYERSQLADAVAYVDQDVTLFEGSVRDNLTLWQAAPEEVLRGALRDAAIETDILMREGGMDAPLQEGARNLSGGQRQRLEIARALVRNPRVLILDEATSALDPTSEALVEQRLRIRNLTCLVVAHRLSTVRDADEIIVLDGGRVTERGTYAELKARDGRFAELVATESVDTEDV
jgi:NHLM bacteriocin system ABC transporter peptidase/ATP-binding protein